MKSTSTIPDDGGYTKEERAEMIRKMKSVSATYYGMAIQTGVHAFIEFTGLLNEFIKVCEQAEIEGLTEWPMANTHNPVVMPFQPYHANYLAEKLNCIYGPSLLASKENREAFVSTVFDGHFKLAPTGNPSDATGTNDPYAALSLE